ncbi:MAG: peptidylprolyl isomerase [Bacteroidales bacterium]|nr:peptidylprolyl isomerase [Bacteroidales bacterium]MCF8456540.1 peptidylprolyl isomerase [Bacteroidales bacterium]
MKKSSLILFLITTLVFSTYAQQSDEVVLMTVNGKEVSKAEFVRIYKKNNANEQSFDQKSLNEYLDLFINFKLKVAEAEALGLDTSKAFVDELAGYRKQLAKPYLVDKEVDQKLLDEAYEHLKWDVKASHILLRLEENASPADTLKVYKRIMDLRKKILAGESFEAVAKRASEDQSAKSNEGDLGYFTGFQMVYPFEVAAFNTPVGEISMPVRTRFGYHIIKVIDKRPARGKIKVAHIMVAVPKTGGSEAASQAKADSLYKRILAGEDFATLAKDNSDDHGSATKGGELPMFGTGRMVPEFEEAAFTLKEVGEVSPLVKTTYGFHIIKLLEKKGIEPYESMKQELKSRISKDARASQSRKALIAQLKKEYKFAEDKTHADKFYTYVTDSILKGTWDGESAKGHNATLFTLDGRNYTEADFTDYLLKNKFKTATETVQVVVNRSYNNWVDQSIIDYEESRLEKKYTDFNYLMNEYHDGILLFELSDQMVWTKAVKDTAGLEAFYEKNKMNYMWGERLDASIYAISPDPNYNKPAPEDCTAGNAKTFPKIIKIIKKRNLKKLSADAVKEKLLALNEKNKGNLKIDIEDGMFSKKDNVLIDAIEWKPGMVEQAGEVGGKTIIVVRAIRQAEPKSLKEARGLVTADYQNYLEAEWIKELRAKYPVVVKEEVLKTIK